MTLQVKQPILVIGLGGVGSKLAIQAKESLHSDCLIISNNQKDITSENHGIHISTDSIINPNCSINQRFILQII